MDWPSVNVSVRAEMRPFGFISRNQGCFCMFLVNSILWTLYGILKKILVSLGQFSHLGPGQVYSPQLLKGDGYLDPIGCLGSVKGDIGRVLCYHPASALRGF